jgi:CubicO group peptidase (beta-lactamase class C family)
MPTLEESVSAMAEAPGSVPWVARHGLTAAAYQGEFDKLGAQGFRLVQVNGYDLNGQPHFAAIWEKKPGPPLIARHNLSAPQYQDEFDKWSAQGFRLVHVSGYSHKGQAHFAAIWEKKVGPPAKARHNMTSAEYQSEFDALDAQGYHLTLVQGYGVGKQARYAAIWEKKSGAKPVARHGLTSAEYQNEFDKLMAKGFRLVHVSGYRVNGQDRYAAIWEKKAGAKWVARHRMTSHSYQAEFVDRSLQGYRLKLVSGYPLLNSAGYAALWEAEPQAVTGSFCTNGQCFDLTRLADNLEKALQTGKVVKYGFEVRRGTSVIQRAAGPARTAANPPARDFTVFDRINPASVGKAVTAVATLHLLAKKGKGIDTLIHTSLPPTWNVPASVKTITFKELLNHTSGFHGDWGGYEYEHMEKMVASGVDPGDKVENYQNVNYALLRILVASLDGYRQWTVSPGAGTASRFIAYVNKHIFAPLGVVDVHYKATAPDPALFYPAPSGSAKGTAYGDWSLKPGSAGGHLSVHDLTIFVAALFHGMVLPATMVSAVKKWGLGLGDYGQMPDGGRAWGKGGFFPGDSNGGAELNSVIVHFDSGVSAMLVVNGSANAKSLMLTAYQQAFSPK